HVRRAWRARPVAHILAPRRGRPRTYRPEPRLRIRQPPGPHLGRAGRHDRNGMARGRPRLDCGRSRGSRRDALTGRDPGPGRVAEFTPTFHDHDVTEGRTWAKARGEQSFVRGASVGRSG